MTFALTHSETVALICAGWMAYSAGAINVLRALARRREAKEA